MNAGRHREASASVTEVVGTQANAGARLAAIGVLGSTTALAAPGMAAAATVGGAGRGRAPAADQGDLTAACRTDPPTCHFGNGSSVHYWPNT